MAGKKAIVLLNTKGESINQHYRYKKVKTAIRRAVDLSITNREHVQVWHLGRGQEVAMVRSGKWGVGIDTPHPNVFNQLWGAE